MQCAGYPAHCIESPPQVPLTLGRGLWGIAVGRPAHGLPLPGATKPAQPMCQPRLAQRLHRSRPHAPSCGGPAAGVTPSAATGATVEPQRALVGFQRPGCGLGGWLRWRSGRHRAKRRLQPASSSCGPVRAQREGGRPAALSHGRAAVDEAVPCPQAIAIQSLDCAAKCLRANGRLR
jgi:hypothetical protein